MEKFLSLVLGTTDVPTYLAGLFFALIGLGFYYKNKVSKRNKNSKNTPYVFSLKFFAQDNLVEMVFSLVAIFLALRFSVEYAGVSPTMFYSLGIGFGLPKFVNWLQNVQANARK
jgi:uncharacterized membrane protein